MEVAGYYNICVIDLVCENCGNLFKRYPYVLKSNRGKYCSKNCKDIALRYVIKGGHPNSLKNLERMTSDKAKKLGFGKWMTGKKLSGKTKEKISLSLKGGNKGSIKKGEHLNVLSEFKIGHIPYSKGKGTKCNKSQLIRGCLEYKKWRNKVYERDQWTCQICSQVGGKLEADHIKPFSLFPELIFNINNGRTLCKGCHKKTPTYLKNNMKRSDFSINLSEEVANKGELTIVPEVGDSSEVYSMFNDGSTECEVSEFLYSFVRMIKPKNICETGTYKGISSSFMALALKDNGFGRLETLEINELHIQTAKQLWDKLGLTSWITSHKMPSLTFDTQAKYQMLFLDSEPQIRFAELLKFYPYLEEGGFIFIHDLHRHMHQIENAEHGFAWPYGKIPQEITDLVKGDKLRPFHFTTPRGLTGFYKVHSSDYKF